MNYQKGFLSVVLLVVVIVILAGIGGYYLLNKPASQTGSVKITFSAGSTDLMKLWPNDSSLRTVRVRDQNGNLVKEAVISSMSQPITIGGLDSGDYVVGVESLGPPGYNQASVTITAGKVLQVMLEVRAYY